MQITVESAAPAIGTIVTLQGKLDVLSTADVEKSLLDVIASLTAQVERELDRNADAA